MFPDAPTARGKRHLAGLLEARRDGYRACILFVVQRSGADRFSPNDETDPEFGKALRNAALNGVSILAYSSIVCENQITLDKRIRILL